MDSNLSDWILRHVSFWTSHGGGNTCVVTKVYTFLEGKCIWYINDDQWEGQELWRMMGVWSKTMPLKTSCPQSLMFLNQMRILIF